MCMCFNTRTCYILAPRQCFSHTDYLKCNIHLSKGEVQYPKSHPTPLTLGTYCFVRATGRLESHRGILCETEPLQLTETPHTCTAAPMLTGCIHCLVRLVLCTSIFAVSPVYFLKLIVLARSSGETGQQKR